MPFYDYECNLCGHHFELKQGFYEEAVAACPKCNGTAKRLWLPVPVIFKGSGFYITENRKDNNHDKEKEKVKPTSASTKTDKEELKTSKEK